MLPVIVWALLTQPLLWPVGQNRNLPAIDPARLGDSPAARPYRVGIDIGGTFSDLVIMDEEGRVSTLKVTSAPDEVIAALRQPEETPA